MLGVDACEFGGQVLELLWLTVCYRGLMSDKSDLPLEEEEHERNLAYTPPAQKSLEEIQEMDKEDESLVKYKQTLLGSLQVNADPSVSNVQVTRLTLLCDEAPAPIVLDLTGDLAALREKTLVLKEGAKYRLKIDFKDIFLEDDEGSFLQGFVPGGWVNREIVSGLRYHEVTQRKGITVDKASLMVGSYGPKAESQEFVSAARAAPQGLMSYGQYVVKSRFIDDDKVVHLEWEWSVAIKKDWD